MNKLLMSTLLSVGLAAAAPLVTAQATNPTPDVQQNRYAQQHDHGKRPFTLPSERVEARLAYLKTALKITDAQQAQWEAFADVLRKHAKQIDERIQARRAQMGQPSRDERPTAIARLERTQERLAAASAKLNELLAVEKPLYAALTPEQQGIADRVLAPRGHGRFHHRGVHRGA